MVFMALILVIEMNLLNIVSTGVFTYKSNLDVITVGVVMCRIEIATLQLSA